MDVTSSDTGIVYYVVDKGDYYVKQLRRSVASIQQFMPTMPITLFTDRELNIEGVDDVRIFKRARSKGLKGQLLIDRVRCLATCPFERNLYIDCDFIALGDLSEMFKLLDKFDLAISHADIREVQPPPEDIPRSFPEFRAGTILYKRTPIIARFFELWVETFLQNMQDLGQYKRLWKSTYGQSRQFREQGALRIALWRSPDLRFYVLPSEWCFAGVQGYLWDKAWLVQTTYHLRGGVPNSIGPKLNADIEVPRVFVNGRIEISR